jgi:hypothetical protein
MIPYDKRDGKREREKENEKKKLFIQGQKTQTNDSARFVERRRFNTTACEQSVTVQPQPPL